MTKSNQWLQVDKEGLAKVQAQRGKEFILFELLSNSWDENVTTVFASLTRPEHGKSLLLVKDDSPDGWHDLRDAWVMFAESYKKDKPNKRGRFDVGDKLVLAMCDKAYIATTTGTVYFKEDGTRQLNPRKKRAVGSEFCAELKLTVAEYERIVAKAKTVISPEGVDTIFNGESLPKRKPVAEFTENLPTVLADGEGHLRQTTRNTIVKLYETLPGEIAMLYEMGIPVVETGDRWHLDVQMKVPLNADRDNVTPSYLAKIRVAVLNCMASEIKTTDANELWVRQAASHPACSPQAITRVVDLRFGNKRVSYDIKDTGSNKEAVSAGYTVVSGGSMSAGEWSNAKQAGAITSAGSMFPTNHGTKVPDKEYSRDEWTPEMRWYAEFVESAAPDLIGRAVHVKYIKDRQMIQGCFHHAAGRMTVNLAKLDLHNKQECLELMIHELAHDAVNSNDHLCREFYEATTRIGARLALLVGVELDWMGKKESLRYGCRLTTDAHQ